MKSRGGRKKDEGSGKRTTRKNGTPPPTLRPLTQARAEQTRERILKIARDHFAEHGFDGVSVRDIAEAAQTTHSMITYHFGSKEQLWRESVRDMFMRAQKVTQAAMYVDSNLPSETRLRAMVHGYVRYCADHPEHARITFAETIRGGERLEWMVNEFVKYDHQGVVPLFEQLMEEGTIPRMPLPSIVYAVVGMAQLPFVLAKESLLAFNYDMMSEAAIAQHADGILALLLPHGAKRGRRNT